MPEEVKRMFDELDKTQAVREERITAPVFQAFFKSPVFLSFLVALFSSLGAVFAAYKPDVPIKAQIPTLGPMLLAAVASAVGGVVRATSTLQPLGLSDKH
jgi:hypothetical protein